MAHSPTVTTSSDPGHKRLTAKEWLEISALARDGTKPPQIAAIYGVHHSVIYRGLTKRGVKVGSAVEEAKRELEERSRIDLIDKIKRTKEGDYKFTEFLQKGIISTIVEAKTPGAVLDDIKSLKIAIDGIRNGTANKWMLLGLDRDNADADEVLPELPIREMTDAEVDAERNRQELEDGIDPTELMEDDDDVPPDDLDGEIVNLT